VNFPDIEPAWWWLIAATLLAIAEILVPGVFLIWLAAGAALTGLAALLFDPPVAFQLAQFAILAIATVYFGRRWYDAHPVATSDPLLNDRAARLMGRTVTVVAAIEDGTGQVRVGDGVWVARGPDIAVGAKVRVTGAQGTCLTVEPVSQAAPPERQLPGAG
jgi:membrane protein implicated in regulation of membrane protease activity